MSVQNYLIDHNQFDWPQLLVGWTGLLPEKFSVWLMNRFGDLFLSLPNGSIQMLDVAEGKLSKLTDSQDEFCQKIDEDENARRWLLIPLVDQLVAAGVRLRPGYCYSFRVPPELGGQPTVENTTVLGVVEHYRTYSLIHNRLHRAPLR